MTGERCFQFPQADPTQWRKLRVYDQIQCTYWQKQLADLKVETQASRPCVVYLNGEYWGLYILQEDYQAKYFEKTHGVAKENVVTYKGDAEALSLGYKLDEGKLPEGEDNESYYLQDVLDFFASHDNLRNEQDYEAFANWSIRSLSGTILRPMSG